MMFDIYFNVQYKDIMKKGSICKKYDFDAEKYRTAIENETNPTWYWYKAALFHTLERGLALNAGLFTFAAVTLADHYILREAVEWRRLDNAKRNYRKVFASDPDVLRLVPIKKIKLLKPNVAFLQKGFESFADTPQKKELLQAIIDAYNSGGLHQKAAVTLCRAHINEEDIIGSQQCRDAERYFRQAYACDEVRQGLIEYRINNFNEDLYKDAADTPFKREFLKVLSRCDSSQFHYLAAAYIIEEDVNQNSLRVARTLYRKLFAGDTEALALLPQREKKRFDKHPYWRADLSTDEIAFLDLLETITKKTSSILFPPAYAHYLAKRLITREDVAKTNYDPAASKFRKLLPEGAEEIKIFERLKQAYSKAHPKPPRPKKSKPKLKKKNKAEIIMQVENPQLKSLFKTMFELPLSPDERRVFTFFALAIIQGKLPSTTASTTFTTYVSEFHTAMVRSGTPNLRADFESAITKDLIPPPVFGVKTQQELLNKWQKAMRRKR